jgi:hypothetical protein
MVLDHGSIGIFGPGLESGMGVKLPGLWIDPRRVVADQARGLVVVASAGQLSVFRVGQTGEDVEWRWEQPFGERFDWHGGDWHTDWWKRFGDAGKGEWDGKEDWHKMWEKFTGGKSEGEQQKEDHHQHGGWWNWHGNWDGGHDWYDMWKKFTGGKPEGEQKKGDADDASKHNGFSWWNWHGDGDKDAGIKSNADWNGHGHHGLHPGTRPKFTAGGKPETSKEQKAEADSSSKSSGHVRLHVEPKKYGADPRGRHHGAHGILHKLPTGKSPEGQENVVDAGHPKLHHHHGGGGGHSHSHRSSHYKPSVVKPAVGMHRGG